MPLFADAAQLAERGIEHIDGFVTACDLDRRHLVVSRSARGAQFEIEAPTLVWATGPRYPKAPVSGLEHAEENTTRAGLVSLARHLALPHRRVVVVGAERAGHRAPARS